MKNFVYYRPKSAEEAVGLLDAKWGKTELLAGGTDLLDLQKEYVAQPEKVISLRDVESLSGIEVKRSGARISMVRIGAGTKLAEIAENLTIRDHFPALATAAGDIGGSQIRNMGTLGGNLCQRNRCWYFRDEHVNCLLKGGDKCFALDGENRYHAVFTKGHPCVIVNPSTLAPALIALGALVEILGPKGKSSMKLADFFRAPKSATEREHILAPNEMVVSVLIPPEAAVMKNASYEVRHKQSYDWPLVQAAVAFEPDQTGPKNVKIVLGHVAPTPYIADAAVKALGRQVTEASATAVGEAAAEGAKPLSQNAYKLKLITVAVKRALLLAAGAKPYWEV
jgi:xanthine dehydrogenase YagS FAD-binding subunit